MAVAINPRFGAKNHGDYSTLPAVLQVSDAELARRIFGPEQTSATQLAEIVWVGSGTQSSKDLRGLVSQVRAATEASQAIRLTSWIADIASRVDLEEVPGNVIFFVNLVSYQSLLWKIQLTEVDFCFSECTWMVLL